MPSDSVSLRVQGLDLGGQVLVLGRIAESRTESGRFSPGHIDDLFQELGLPRPSRVSNLLAKLESAKLIARRKGRGEVWVLTPKGRAESETIVSQVDLSRLVSETRAGNLPLLGEIRHPLVPPELAPPEIRQVIHQFLENHPFDRNVFGMTRYPDPEGNPDPLSEALEVCGEVCERHGLEFHLAKERSISDDLWTNVAAHMWASRYGIALVEDREAGGLNYNLTAEVGAMIMTGRRCALLKDQTIESLPTDFVGKIYRTIDLDDSNTVSEALHGWIREDLGLGPCDACPQA